MRLDDRQRAMLGAMGLTIWGPPGPADRGALAQPDARRQSTTEPPAAAVTEAAAPDNKDAGRRIEIGALGWTALRDKVAQCKACRLHEGRTQTVFGVGHEQAHWMLVGEAPGENEDRQGEPFVGAAGQLLDRMLHAVGLTRSAAPPERQVYIANTLKCRPPRNRNPEPDELALCSAFLARQIELVQPRIILAMGRFAVQTLLGSDAAIGKLRGQVHRYRDRPVIVTYHPAYLLRNPADKARSWADLCLAASLSAPVG